MLWLPLYTLQIYSPRYVFCYSQHLQIFYPLKISLYIMSVTCGVHVDAPKFDHKLFIVCVCGWGGGGGGEE